MTKTVISKSLEFTFDIQPTRSPLVRKRTLPCLFVDLP